MPANVWLTLKGLPNIANICMPQGSQSMVGYSFSEWYQTKVLCLLKVFCHTYQRYLFAWQKTGSKRSARQKPQSTKVNILNICFYIFRLYIGNNKISIIISGDDRTRTDDFMRAKHAFYQLNYTPFMYFHDLCTFLLTILGLLNG